ncbi:hypothetical protein ACJD0Z_10495 [Flavobacteriaceae bacterium M23B6Z8]
MKKRVVNFNSLKLAKSSVALLNGGLLYVSDGVKPDTEWPKCKATDGFTCGPVCDA